jgi:hypothetical protein
VLIFNQEFEQILEKAREEPVFEAVHPLNRGGFSEPSKAFWPVSI